MSEIENRTTIAVVVLAKGGYGEWPQRELAAMVQAAQATGRYCLVTGAFIDQGAPHLSKALAQCLDAGAQRIVVVPAFVPVDRTLREWLPKILRRWTKKQHIGRDVEIVLAQAIGDHPALGAAVAAVAAGAENASDVRMDAPLKDRANLWTEIPAHQYHALLCAGPRCTTLGAMDLWAYLHQRLRVAGILEEPGGVATVRTGCVSPCNLGPMMVVHPDDCWYGALSEAALDQIVTEHFIGGKPVDTYRRPRPRPEPERTPPSSDAG